MLNQLSIRCEVFQKEMDLEKRENIYLKKQNEALELENEKMQDVVETLQAKIAGFDDFLNIAGRNNVKAVPADFVSHLQISLNEAKKKQAETEAEVKNLRASLDEERENFNR